tara:strand:+ start:2118 stop:2333 length:216 start_codon:yes stop_codon:yes gene_type:complete
VAFILPTKSRTKFSTKVILGGELAKEAIREGVSKGSTILASGDNYKIEGNCLKLFANMCMRVDEFEKDVQE